MWGMIANNLASGVAILFIWGWADAGWSSLQSVSLWLGQEVMTVQSLKLRIFFLWMKSMGWAQQNNKNNIGPAFDSIDMRRESNVAKMILLGEPEAQWECTRLLVKLPEFNPGSYMLQRNWFM